MPLLSSRELRHVWAEGYWWGVWSGVTIMLVAVAGGALWWLAGA
jgi:hypothetical protein